MSTAGRHERAVARSLGFAEAAATSGDFYTALEWLRMLEVIDGDLPVEWERTRAAWMRDAAIDPNGEPLVARPAGPSTEARFDGLDLELSRDPSAPGRARSEVRRATVAVLAEDASATATLLTSEIVTNAVVHPQPDEMPIRLRIRSSRDGLRVEVSDSGTGFDPARVERGNGACGGRGLLLVDRLSDSWGTTRRTSRARHGFSVWFELRRTPEAAVGSQAS